MLNKNTWGVKNARLIRSNIANRQVQSKGLISAKANKLLNLNIFNSLNKRWPNNKANHICENML